MTKNERIRDLEQRVAALERQAAEMPRWTFTPSPNGGWWAPVPPPPPSITWGEIGRTVTWDPTRMVMS